MVDEATQGLAELAEEFVPWYLESHPVRASMLGVHDHDALLPDMSRPGIQSRIDELLNWLSALEMIRFDHLEGQSRVEFAVLEYGIRNELLELEEVRGWARDPRLYVSTIVDGLKAIADSTSAGERAQAMQGRLEAGPALLMSARENVTTPPRLWAELAVEDARWLVRFLSTDLEKQLAGGGENGEIPAGVAAARDELVAAVESYSEWLRTDVVPRANGDFRLGRFLLERKLLHGEHVALDVDDLQRLNETAIGEYQRWLDQVASEIDPSRTTAQVVDSVLRVQPAPDNLVEAVRNRMEAARDWTVETGVVGVADAPLPLVQQARPHDRIHFAWLDAPGPFEETGQPMVLTLAAPQPEWSMDDRQEFMTVFNTAELTPTVLNHAFPGSVAQRAYARDKDSPILRIFPSRTFAEGWAHYAEQMALDAGFAANDPAVRLTQLRRALQRHARWHAVVALHARGADIDQVVEDFMGIAYAAEYPARQQVHRATWDPLFLSAALGRMQIVELRKDFRTRVEEEDEDTFELADFHIRLLELAFPLPLARDIILPLRQNGPADSQRRR